MMSLYPYFILLISRSRHVRGNVTLCSQIAMHFKHRGNSTDDRSQRAYHRICDHPYREWWIKAQSYMQSWHSLNPTRGDSSMSGNYLQKINNLTGIVRRERK
ncbi:pH-response regulator protein palI/prr-5 [Fusarium oxysporum f. sp. albedinis]|nr:pH-response regulator protein palI/prr-5 [Fusarium oxysporum f. sp. albedinis]